MKKTFEIDGEFVLLTEICYIGKPFNVQRDLDNPKQSIFNFSIRFKRTDVRLEFRTNNMEMYELLIERWRFINE